MNGKIGPPQVARELLLSLLHNYKHAAHLQRMALGCVGFRFVSSIAEGVPAWSLKDELIALEQRQEKLEREIARGPEAQPLLHPNLAGLYRQKVAALEEALADPEEDAQAMEMIRLLIDALVLTPGGKAARRPYGRAGRILSIAQKGKRPRPEDEAHASHVKLVAGARYPLCKSAAMDPKPDQTKFQMIKSRARNHRELTLPV